MEEVLAAPEVTAVAVEEQVKELFLEEPVHKVETVETLRQEEPPLVVVEQPRLTVETLVVVLVLVVLGLYPLSQVLQ